MRSDSGLDIVASNLINLAQGTQTIGGRRVTKPAGSAWDTAGEEGRSAVGGTESMTPTGARSRFRPWSGGRQRRPFRPSAHAKLAIASRLD